MMRVALDSNILAYLAGVSRSAEDDGKIAQVRGLVSRLGESVSLIAPASVHDGDALITKRMNT